MLGAGLRRGVAAAGVLVLAGRGQGLRVARRGLASGSASTSANSFNMQAAGGAAAGMLCLLAFGRGGEAAPADAEPAATAASEPAESSVTVVIESGADEERIASLEGRVQKIESAFAVMAASAKNQAFVFIKPHAVTDAVEKLVAEGLAKAGIEVKAEGTLGHDVIDSKQLIDTHYGAIASKAVSLKPEDQNVPEKGQKQFKEMFGEDWAAAVAEGKVFNAADACKKLGIDGEQLDAKWSTLSRDKDLLKFGGGHYVGKVDGIYIINGFYMSMRQKYCSPPAKIHYFVVEWDPAQLAWEDFRGKVLGGTDPTTAEEGSLRRVIYEKWEELGLPAVPDVGDNGVHASASPFEAMAERVNWCGADLDNDVFGKAVLSLGVPKEKLKQWMADAQVVVDGKKTSLFDFLEDQNSGDNLERLVTVLAQNN